MKESLILSSIRSFLVALCAMIGVGIGLLLLSLMIALFVSDTDDQMKAKTQYTATILPNATDSRKALSKNAPVILTINISGFIGSETLNTQTIQQQLIESREGDLKDNRVKAILVHINSPGGAVFDADGIYRALNAYKEKYKVPVFAYVDGLCASGGMYVAAAADKIYASDVSLIGSIGVLSPAFFNVSSLMEKIGVENKILSSGKGKDALNPFRPWKPGEDDNLKGIIDYFYNEFVDIIVKNRPEISRARLVSDYGALVFPAQKAAELGFIDATGYSTDDTLKLLAKEIGIEDDYYQVIKMEKKFSLGELFKTDVPLISGTMKHRIELFPGMDVGLLNQYLYLYMPNN